MKFLLLLSAVLSCVNVQGQTYAIKAGQLIDGISDTSKHNLIVIVYKNKIIEINSNNHIPDSAEVVDLSGYTILPGLIDVHTHILADGDDYDKDLYSNSAVFRALRAVSYLGISLQNGFTTLRDVCSEGTGFADVDLARAINLGLIKGPRLIPSTKGIAIRGFYVPQPSHQNPEFQLPSGSQYVSGLAECIEAVREQVSRGAQWIKVFADWPTPYGIKQTFTAEELSAVVKEAHRLGVRVAAHAECKDGIELAINAGVNSIEHGEEFTEELMQKAIVKDIYWSPTVTVFEFFHDDVLPSLYTKLHAAYKKGVKIVLGTDAGSYPWKINQAKELEYYVDNAGFGKMDAIKSGTSLAAKLLGMEDKLGEIKINYLADIIAVKGNLLNDIKLLQNVEFVMKDGQIIKRPK